MKSTLRAIVLVVNLIGWSNAYAFDLVLDTSNLIQTTLTAVKSAATAASTKIMEAKTTAMEAFDKSAWGKQTAQMVETIKGINNTIAKVNEAKEKLTSEITGFTSEVTGFVAKVQARNAAFPQRAVKYDYAQSLPDSLMTEATCKDDKPCDITDPGYKSTSANLSSLDLRDSLKVKADEVGGSFSFFGTSIGNGKSIAQISREAAELNAQELAVIDTMAREAYLQASNRVAAINDLQGALLNPPAGEANSLKYTTDVQAMIVAEQAFLINDQNRIAALAVLQQSQRDRYEQRKKEIVEFVTYGDRSVKTGTFDPTDPTTYLSDSTYQGLKRVAIATTTQAAFSALQTQYK